jgi:hypothetical protein
MRKQELKLRNPVLVLRFSFALTQHGNKLGRSFSRKGFKRFKHRFLPRAGHMRE